MDAWLASTPVLHQLLQVSPRTNLHLLAPPCCALLLLGCKVPHRMMPLADTQCLLAVISCPFNSRYQQLHGGKDGQLHCTTLDAHALDTHVAHQGRAPIAQVQRGAC